MKTFIINLLSPHSGVSSKRFISLGSFLVAIGFSIVSIFMPVEMSIIYSFISLAAGGTVATAVEKP